MYDYVKINELRNVTSGDASLKAVRHNVLSAIITGTFGEDR